MPRRKLFAVTLCVFSLLLLIACSRPSANQPSQPEAPKEFAAMVAKKGELAALATSEKLSKLATLKGKIAIVKNSDGDISVDRFSEDGATFDSDPPIPVGETWSNFLPAELYAKTPDEIETLVKIDCVTKKDEALYTRGDSTHAEPKIYEYVICDVGLVDYKTATVYAKKRAGKNTPPSRITGSTIARHPWREIAEFIRSAANTNKKSVS
jgi:hypothetical protein